MHGYLTRTRWGRLLVASASGTVFFLQSCDPTLRATIEDGIITSSASFVGSLIRAMIEVAAEQQSTTTAQAIIDVAQRAFA